MIILRQKEYSDAGLGIGLVGGFSTGALAGNYAQKKVQNLYARRKYNPEEEAEKLEKSAESYEEAAEKLRQNKDYMKLVEEKRSRQKEIDEKYPDADSDWETEMDALDEEYNSKLKAGDPDTLESFAISERSAAKKIRQNPKEAKKRAGKDAERNVDRPVGAWIGGATGAILGGAIGSRIKRKNNMIILRQKEFGLIQAIKNHRAVNNWVKEHGLPSDEEMKAREAFLWDQAGIDETVYNNFNDPGIQKVLKDGNHPLDREYYKKSMERRIDELSEIQIEPEKWKKEVAKRTARAELGLGEYKKK